MFPSASDEGLATRATEEERGLIRAADHANKTRDYSPLEAWRGHITAGARYARLRFLDATAHIHTYSIRVAHWLASDALAI